MKIELTQDLTGHNHIGYMRSDIPMFHTIVRAKGGSVFTLDGHFDHCDVCKEHKVTLADFEAFMSG